MSNPLPEGLTVRPATLDDIEIMHSLFQTYERALYGESDRPLANVRSTYSVPDLDLTHDTCLVFAQDGQLVGSMLLEQKLHAKFFVTVRILPGYSNPSLGDYLLSIAEKRARVQMVHAQPDARITLTGWVPSVDQAGLHSYERAGFQQMRHHWRMEIDLHDEPADPAWPEGINLRPFVPERDAYAVYEMVNTAFQDHWGYVPESFEVFQYWTIKHANFDPAFWFVAYEGEQIAGGALCFVKTNPPWVDTLAVLRPWRRKGLGLALLQHAFGEFYRHGLRKAGLGVDAQNLTGATRLYQRAGMHIAREHVVHEKELRAGVELSTQELAD